MEDTSPVPADETLLALRKAFADAPQNGEAGARLAQYYADRGWLNEALDVYRTLVRQEGSNFSLLLDYGHTCFKKQEVEEAARIFTKLTELKPDRIEGWNNLGIVQLAKGDETAAMESFGRVLAIEPDNAGALLNLGNCHYKSGNAAGAAEQFRKAATVRPDFADAWFNLGNAQVQLGDIDRAIESYRRALRIQREFPSAMKNLGVALEQRGDLDGAVECYRQALELSRADSGLYVNLGNVLTKKKNYDEARQYYLQAVQLSPREMPAWMGLRHLALLKGDIAGYVKSTHAVFARLDQRSIAESVMVLRELSHFKEADDLLARADSAGISGDEIDAERLAAHARRQSDSGVAYAIFHRLSQKQDLSDRVLACLSQYAFDSGRTDEGMELAGRLEKKDVSLLKRIWQSLIVTGRPGDAEQQLVAYLSGHEDCFDAWFLLATLKTSQEKNDEARQCLVKALENGFSDFDLITRDEKLHTIFKSLQAGSDQG
jgi:tetratricopeptide (TPR) repeat protein